NAAMNDAMADGGNGPTAEPGLEPVDQLIGRLLVRGGGDGSWVGCSAFVRIGGDGRIGQADALDLASEDPRWGIRNCEQRELDAGRAAVDGEDTGHLTRACYGVRSGRNRG